MDRLEVRADNHQAYLFTDDFGKAYLYLFVLTDKPTSKLYIYNLCNGKIRKPTLYEGDYSLYNGEITDPEDFKLQRPENSVVDSAVQKSFYIDKFGMPETDDDCAKYIGADSLIFGNKIAKRGETIVLDKTKEFYVDNGDGIDCYRTVKKGEKFTLYEFDAAGAAYKYYYNTIWLKTKDGEVLGFKSYDDNFTVVNE